MTGLLGEERYQVVVGLVIFAFPAIVLAVSRLVTPPNLLVRVLPVCVLLGPLLYWWLTAPEDRSDRGERTKIKEKIDIPKLVAATDSEIPELVAANYSRLSEESQYRDQLLINANYFSLAVIAVFVNVFFRVNTEFRPLIAMAGAATAYSFWLATESYKGARDELNDNMRYMEYHYEELSVVSDYDTRDRSRVGKRSLSSLFIGIQSTATILWTLVYLLFVVRFGYF